MWVVALSAHMAAPIPPHTVEQIKAAADVVEVVESYIPLKKKGANFWALSPFTSEKTPSFSVSPSKGIFKCFSTGKGGDGITFVMEMEGIGYPEALRMLAQRYNIEIEEAEQTPEQQADRLQRESALIALEAAATFYEQQLLNDEGKAIGRSYFTERGFTAETIKKFRLGYAPDSWNALLNELTQQGFSAEVLEAAGLINQKDKRSYDRFRGRVMFSITNVHRQSTGLRGAGT